MVVDDEPSQRKLIGGYFEGFGFTIIEAPSAEVMLEAIAAQPPDMILLDVRLPEMSGIDALPKIRELLPSTPVVLITAYADVRQAVAAVKSDADDYLSKPIDLEELKIAVYDALAIHLTGEEESKTALPELPAAFICESRVMRQLVETVAVVAPSDAPILIQGPSGAGNDPGNPARVRRKPNPCGQEAWHQSASVDLQTSRYRPSEIAKADGHSSHWEWPKQSVSFSKRSLIVEFIIDYTIAALFVPQERSRKSHLWIHVMYSSRFGLAAIFASMGLTVVHSIASADDRPNIIVFYTDDHGYADLSCQGVFADVKTPNVDALAKSGVLARHGYSTAPQCVPSRAGLLIGKFQSRFGVEANGNELAGFDRELTIAERLQRVGYVTAQFGKWHLGAGPQITEHGFKHVFSQNAQTPFAANISLDGADRPMSNLLPEMYHIDGCSRAAAAVIDRYKDDPFFLYVAYRAPHVPLDAPQKYLDRFSDKLPHRRQQALAMLSAVDDGVGLITSTLAKHNLTEKTLVFYIGDNGAPLKIHKLDAPGGGPGWDGSLNDPLNGEKGMLSEGGMHVPFVISWPGTIPGGQIYEHPVSALDVAATAVAIAKLDVKNGDLDGVNLVPFLTRELKTAPHDALMWRWTAQSAIREGNWKLLRGGEREYLYDLTSDLEEKHNVADKNPDVATRLRERLAAWAAELDPPGFDDRMSQAASDYFDFYLDGKQPTRVRTIDDRKSKGLVAPNKKRPFQKKAASE